MIEPFNLHKEIILPDGYSWWFNDLQENIASIDTTYDGTIVMWFRVEPERRRCWQYSIDINSPDVYYKLDKRKIRKEITRALTMHRLGLGALQ